MSRVKEVARVWLVVAAAFVPAVSYAQPQEIFSIGTRNGSFAEFARRPDAARVILYRVGESSPGEDWPAYQPGSFDAAVGRSTMHHDWVELLPSPAPQPFQVQFDLSASPRGVFTLHLDAIFRYRRPAAPRYSLLINGKEAASYRLNPHPAPELWWPNGGEAEGNTQYFGFESLEMELPATWFTPGTNTISISCQDGFGIHYDRLSLSNDVSGAPQRITAASLEPTILYKASPSGLIELADVRVRTTHALGKVKLRAVVGAASFESEITQLEAGDLETTIEVPAPVGPVPVSLYIAGENDPIYRGIFTPRRRWQVYALPTEQADFGYNDLPARTLEWENRFIDKTLRIQEQHPSYSFTLDAAANLESFLATRDDQHGRKLLDLLRNGKWGINALYANFFTGLSTPEELYRTLDYSLRAAREHHLVVDSASQTDEPSITWAVPQILADAGIKYFTNGSDPIRGALNPIGHLNFQSPFYWETATGSKVLTWSGVSYTAVDDMTWSGWSQEAARRNEYAPSIFGLRRSLPLFLSQYDRDDFPFDAVLLFGLHNDEIPMRHWGDADVIDMWNKEYAFPRIIPATQREFFTHITNKFEGKIKTYRGDGGAYWEDEAGADARTTAMIRTAQTQLTAAEKFESVASWLQPHLKVDREAFSSAWKNILLANSYVWSDANSFRRPDSKRTLAAEAAHRAWAEAALQQSNDLQLVAMDKVAELVDSDRPGFVVFNAESAPRSDFFDVELDPHEILVNPGTGGAIPCGTMRALNDYQEARCWASDVPAMGYKFYSIEEGTIREGKVLSLDRSAPTIENSFYRVQFDVKTGAIAHMVDKSTGRDLVDLESDFKLNEYLYVSGGDPGRFINGSVNDNRILAADVTLPVPKLEIHRASLTSAPQALSFPWGTVITTSSRAENTPTIFSTITILDLKKRIDIHNEVEKVATLSKEAVYFSFPFALQKPRIKYQGATAWVDPEADMLPGANRQWFATQAGVWGAGAHNGVAWATSEAPLITLQDINRGLWPQSIQIRNGSVFSYVMNNYWYTDTPAQQGGRFTFRYAITSGSEVSAAQALSLASEHRSKLTAIRRYSMGWKTSLPDRGTGFLHATPEEVRVIGVKPLEVRGSYLVRVQNSTANEVVAHLQFPTIEPRESYLGSPTGSRIGTVNGTSRDVEIRMKKYEIKSLVICMH